MRAVAVVLLFVLALVAFGGGHAPAPGPERAMAAESAPAVEMTVAHPAAPKLTLADYPTYRGLNSRLTVWIAAQLHLRPLFLLAIRKLA